MRFCRHKSMKPTMSTLALAIATILVFTLTEAGCESEPVTESFAIYGPDKEYQDIVIERQVKIPAELSLEDKIQALADSLSEIRFKGLPMELRSLEMIGDNKVAIMNLRELPPEKRKDRISWRGLYFQGSAGGFLASRILPETFLQKPYEGEWIDGVTFLYESDQISENKWEHVSLNKVFYR
ncbi:MAG: hypothetical protein JSU69_04585 [Candidatus Zixiibacteriota bacterium]|nr:MAG: hypothetical protein JSU69_04585 [candidate division Zixibacteria bacterium]